MTEVKEQQPVKEAVEEQVIDPLAETVKKEITALKEEVKLAKESFVKVQEALAKSKGNLTESVQAPAPYIFVENFREHEAYAENALIVKGKGSGKMEIFAARPDKWY